jgi:Tol biopolymer transport system component
VFRIQQIASDAISPNAGAVYLPFYPAISDNGRFVAFEQYVFTAGETDPNLDTPRTFSIYDALTEATTTIEIGLDGVVANGSSFLPAFSGDGRFVAFLSSASNLVAGDTNNVTDLFLYDRTTGTITQLAAVAGPNQNIHGYDFLGAPSVSQDGRFIAFESFADDLVAGDTNTSADIFVIDTVTGDIERVSVATDGTESDAGSFSPSISADGRYIAFWSFSDALDIGDNNGSSDVFLHDRSTGETRRISDLNAVMVPTLSAYLPKISADGNYVTYQALVETSTFTSPGGETFSTVRFDNYLYNVETGRTFPVAERQQLVLPGTRGWEPNGNSVLPTISQNGRYISFVSQATNLANDPDGSNPNAFIQDIRTNLTRRIADEAGTLTSTYAQSISADGRSMALYTSQGAFLVTVFGQTDFDGDGVSEFVSYDPDSGNVAINYFFGEDSFYSGNVSSAAQLGPDWMLEATGDFDADGKEDDFAWRNYVTGENALWFTEFNTWHPVRSLTSLFVGGRTLLEVVGEHWKLQGAGDFDDDYYQDDLVWLDSTTGEVIIWYTENGSVVGGGKISASVAPNTGWEVAGVGDFDADNRQDDLLWRNAVTGDNAVWFMDGLTAQSSAFTTAVPDNDWQVIEISDFDQDGLPDDLMWRHLGTDQTVVWFMDGATSVSGKQLTYELLQFPPNSA